MTKNESNGIWVFAEQKNGKLDSTSFELIAKALDLKATLNEDVTAVVLRAVTPLWQTSLSLTAQTRSSQLKMQILQTTVQDPIRRFSQSWQSSTSPLSSSSPLPPSAEMLLPA